METNRIRLRRGGYEGAPDGEGRVSGDVAEDE